MRDLSEAETARLEQLRLTERISWRIATLCDATLCDAHSAGVAVQQLFDERDRITENVPSVTDNGTLPSSATRKRRRPAKLPDDAAEGNPRANRGPKSDDDGHRRVAELLLSGWEDDMKGFLQRLADPGDGGPDVKPSKAWQRKYNITSYAEVFEAVGDKEIRQHLSRRRELGIQLMNSRQLSEIVGRSG